jgi:hypothetical protein
MPTDHILALLTAERDKLDKAIEALAGPTKRRGRPPKNPLEASIAAAAPAPAKRRMFTAAQRKQQAARMKAYWAAKKNVPATEAVPAKKPGFSAATRRKMAAAQRKRWALARKAEK